MNPFWPFMAFTAPAPTSVTSARQMRLRDLDARMSSFLAEKQNGRGTCSRVTDNVKGNRMNVRRELAPTS
ncbi:MAG: hypothetical protein ABJJ37_06290 [Roseibium sp.]